MFLAKLPLECDLRSDGLFSSDIQPQRFTYPARISPLELRSSVYTKALPILRLSHHFQIP